jgi:hypothetical protein
MAHKRLLLVLAALFLARPAQAQETPVSAPAPEPQPPPPPPPPPVVVLPAPAMPPPPAPPIAAVASLPMTIPWSGPTGEGVSFGIEEGGWSGVFGSGLRVHVPFFTVRGEREKPNQSGSVGMTLRGLVFTAPTLANSNVLTVTNGNEGPAYHAGGRIELTGATPVFFNLIRIYGGGGVDVFSAIGTGVSHQPTVSGGGEFGFEFFNNRHVAYFIEIGGHGSVDTGLPGGETVVAGIHFYPFSK